MCLGIFLGAGGVSVEAGATQRSGIPLMACPDESSLHDLLHGALSQSDAADLAAHCADCASCAARLLADELLLDANRLVDPFDWVPGTRLGRYLAIEHIGRGGMGVVLAAYDPTLDRKVAIKLVRPDRFSGSEGKSRLLREAKALAQLSHPNVVAVYDAGEVDDDVFIAMELVDGASLSAWLGEQPRSWRDIVEVFRQAGLGLAAAHAAGLVHRDFKPGNLLIGRERVRVADFGLARISREPHETPSPSPRATVESLLSSKLTVSRALVGTPAYMAPEQLQGLPTDARSDQFSFCVSLYEALYGVRPFSGATLAEHRDCVLGGRVAPPPKGKAVPSWLHQLLLRGLRVHAEERFESMPALLAALGHEQRRRRRLIAVGAAALLALAAVSGHALRARRDLPCRGADAQLHDRWDAPIRAAVAAAFAASGAPYAASASATVLRAVDRYTARWVAMRTEICEATFVRHEQSNELLDLRMGCLDQRLAEVETLGQLFTRADLAVVERSVSTVAGLTPLSHCSDVALLRGPVMPATAAMRTSADELRKQLARIKVLMFAGRLDDARARLDSVIPAAHALGYAPVEAEALFAYGTLDDHPRDAKTAEAKLLDAVLAAERGRHTEVAIQSWSYLSFLLLQQHRLDDARRALDHALALLASMGDPPALEAFVLGDRGVLARHQDRFDDAISYFRRVIELKTRIQGEEDTLVAAAWKNLASVLGAKGEFAAAVEAEQRALTIDQRMLGPEHPTIGILESDLGLQLLLMARAAEALEHARRGFAIIERVRGPKTEVAGRLLMELAVIESDAGELERSLEDGRRAIAILEAVIPNTSRMASNYVNFGGCLNGSGHFAEAVSQLEHARAIYEKTMGPDAPSLHAALDNLGLALTRLGRAREAVVQLERSLALEEKGLGPKSEQMIETLVNLADAKLALHRHAEADTLLERAWGLARSEGDRAQVQFGQARATHARDRARALGLAEAARDSYVRLRCKRRVDEVGAWIAQHS
jgi:tetratricopeptide (TPR) repeat protein/predicted Ser/Thr protein kinase